MIINIGWEEEERGGGHNYKDSFFTIACVSEIALIFLLWPNHSDYHLLFKLPWFRYLKVKQVSDSI